MTFFAVWKIKGFVIFTTNCSNLHRLGSEIYGQQIPNLKKIKRDEVYVICLFKCKNMIFSKFFKFFAL